MRRLVLVRHGESRWNAEGRIQGQSCDGLSELGHRQAELVAAHLAATYPDARLVSSDLQRCVETAAPLATALGHDPVLDPALRERSFGSWERRLRTDVIAAEPRRWRRWLDGEDVVAEVGGESAQMLADRVAPVLQSLLKATDDDGVTIVVTHGGPVWHGTHRLLGLAPGTLGGVGNTSVTELVGYDGTPTGVGVTPAPVVLDRWNELAHLGVALRTGWKPTSATSDGPPVGR